MQGVKSQATFNNLKPATRYLKPLERLGDQHFRHFVSRFFAPGAGIPEDPVTGSAHCTLIPYWSERLGKKELHALQLSERGGELFCADRGERVSIGGRAVMYLSGMIRI